MVIPNKDTTENESSLKRTRKNKEESSELSKRGCKTLRFFLRITMP